MTATSTFPDLAATRRSGLVSVDGRTFPLRASAIEARAEGGLAESRLIQTYVNPYKEALEVIYTMPLPADGAVIGYTITIGDRVITGEIERLEDARDAYRRALQEGRTAGLLEQSRPDTFIQKLGSLSAGATARIEIRVLHSLAFRPRPAGGDEPAAWEYRFPTVVGVRYHGEAGRVPDAADLDADRADGDGTPVRLDLDLLLADGAPADLRPRSASHGIRVEAADGGCRVRLDEAARLDRDLLVSWNAAGSEVGVRLIEGPGLPGDDGRYGLITITPPDRVAATLARDLTILIDASGSMSGGPLDASKQVVLALLESLGTDDRFEILAFGSAVQKLVAGPVATTMQAVRQARDRLARLQASGGTEMTHAIIEALSPLRPDSQRQVVLLTDGYIGFESEVIAETLRRLQPDCRVHTIGVGSAPNRTLTRGVARAGRGTEHFIPDSSDAEAAARRLLAATVGPVLTDVTITGSACRAVAPRHVRDVLAGQPLVLALELEPNGGAIEIRGRLAGTDEPRAWTIPVPATHDAAAKTTRLPIGALYGREAVEDHELDLATCGGGSKSLTIEQAIEALGLRHRITTRRTSLVAVADEPSVDPSLPRRRRRLEVELPSGVSAEGVGLMAAPAMVSCLDAASAGVANQSPEQYRAAFRMLTRPRLDLESLARPFRLNGEIISRENLLLIEVECPFDGFELPAVGDIVEVTHGRETRRAEVVETTPGTHKAGLILRLRVRISDLPGADRGTIKLRWTSPDGKDFELWARS